MPELKTLLDREARDFDLPPDLFDRTRRVVTRRQRRRRVSASLVALVVAFGGLGAAWVAFNPTRHNVGPGHSGLATGGGTSGPTTSPGPLIGKIVIAGETFDGNHGKGGLPQLMVLDPGSAQGTILAPSPYPQWDPAVSPDGSRIAYRGYDGPEEGDYDLYVMNADGTDVTRLTQGALAANPSWSPDGSDIAFGTSGNGGIPGQFVGRAFIEIISVDGSGLHALTDPPQGAEDSSPTWSPDGGMLAFVRLMEQDGYQIYTIHADGTGTTQVTSTPGLKSHPEWSPDGHTIVFQETLSGAPSQISSVAVDGGTSTELTDAAGNSTNPVWIDEGTRIAYEYQEGATNEIRTMDPDGANDATVASSNEPPLSGPQFVAAFDWRT
jgi:Tol biopolymer transport system component